MALSEIIKRSLAGDALASDELKSILTDEERAGAAIRELNHLVVTNVADQLPAATKSNLDGVRRINAALPFADPIAPCDDERPPTVTRRVITESGTIYEFDDEHKLVRRVLAGDAEDMRRDGEWLQLFITNVAIPGYSMCLYLEPLNSDTGKHPFTFRRTSPVVSVEVVA